MLSTRAPFSDLYSEDYQAFVRKLAPHATFQVWEDISHFVMMEDSERFERLLVNLLASLR